MPNEVKQDSEDTKDFNAAFDQASNPDEGKKPADDQKPDDETDPEKKPDTGTDDEADNEGTDDDKAKDDADQDEDDKSDEGKKSDEDWKAKYEAEQQRTRSWEGRLRKQAEENEALKRRLSELEKAKDTGTDKSDEGKKDADPEPDDSEAQKILEAFYEDFPSLKKPLEVLLKKQRKEVRAELETELTGKVDAKLKPVLTRVEEEALSEHIGKIAAGHSDWEAVSQSEKFDGWIKSQPSYLRKAYEGVLQDGSAEEIVDLLWTYKEANGLGRRSANKDGSADKGDKNNRRERQADDAEAVRRKGGKYPTGKHAGPDQDDFSGAFEEAAAKA